MLKIKSAVVVVAIAATLGVAALTQMTAGALGARGEEPVIVEEPANAPTPQLLTVGPRDAKAAKTFKGFKAGPAPQVIPVSGTQFEPGLTATLEAPLGLSTTFPASVIGDLTPTSFTLGVTLDEPGTYLLSVRNRDGNRSRPIQIVVRR